jgi:hypothetical protein
LLQTGVASFTPVFSLLASRQPACIPIPERHHRVAGSAGCGRSVCNLKYKFIRSVFVGPPRLFVNNFLTGNERETASPPAT